MRVEIKNEREEVVATVNAKEVNGRLTVSNATYNRVLNKTVYGLNGLYADQEIWNKDLDVPAFLTNK